MEITELQGSTMLRNAPSIINGNFAEVEEELGNKVNTTTYTTKIGEIDESITTLTNGKVDTTTYNEKMTSLDSSVASLSSGKAPLDSPAFTTNATLDGYDILTEGDVLTLEEIEASTSLADTDVASASALKDLVKFIPKKETKTINANNYAVFTKVSCETPQGYTLISRDTYVNHDLLLVGKNSNIGHYVTVYNHYSVAQETTVTVNYLFVKSGIVGWTL